MSELGGPTLSGFVKGLRLRRGYSRQELAHLVHASVGYIAKIESGGTRSPGQSVLERMSSVFELDLNDRQHLFDLSRQPIEQSSVSETNNSILSSALLDPSQKEALDLISPHLMAFLDERWNLIECNSAYSDTFPGIVDSGNVLRWLFLDERARDVMVDWAEEARLTVYWLRGLLGRNQDESWSREILESLRECGKFRDFWNEGKVLYGRAEAHMCVRNITSTKKQVINVQFFRADTEFGILHTYFGFKTDL